MSALGVDAQSVEELGKDGPSGPLAGITRWHAARRAALVRPIDEAGLQPGVLAHDEDLAHPSWDGGRSRGVSRRWTAPLCKCLERRAQ